MFTNAALQTVCCILFNNRVVQMIFYWSIAVTVIFFAILYKYFSRNVNFWKDRGVNGPKPLPLFGNLIDNLKTSITELELERSRKYGKIYGFLEATQPVLSVSDIDLIKLITMKDFNCFTNHANMAPGDPFLSKLLINTVDEDWKRVRNICIPAFTTKRIKQMFPLVSQVVDNSIEYFDEMEAMKKPIELQTTFSSFAVDVIARTVFGVEVNSFKDPDSDYSRNACTIFPSSSPAVIIGQLMPPLIRRFFGFYLFNPSSCEYFRKLVKHVIKERKGKETKQKHLLQLLLTAELNDAKSLNVLNDEGLGGAYFEVKDGKRKLDEIEILAQSVQMIVAGTETTSTLMMYFMFTMATKPEIQDKLYNELKRYFEDEKYDFDSLMSLSYLDAVLNETLRRYSPAIQLDRVASCDYQLGDTGITIPKGTIVNIPFHAIHHEPDYWPDPFEFKPERFLPENKHEIVPYTFAPFGYGPRICLGMKLAIAELKAIIANLIYRFEVVKTDKTPTVPKYSGKKLTNHCDSIYVSLKKRNL